MPLQATSGAASYDGFGGGVPVVPAYIEEVFSCFLYTGNGSTQTIINGIDESGKGAMTWIKCRSTAYTNRIFDTTRGATKFLVTSSTAAEDTNASTLTAFSSSGFSVGASTAVNESAATYASWTFRKQPKFFDVVTYTGTGSARTIAHNLGSVPGCIIVKRTNTTSNWRVYHRSLTSAAYMVELNSSAGEAVENGAWNSTAPTSSVFTVGSASEVNASGSTYVAYVFAHDAGGFGLLGTDNVISCGSFTTNGSGVASVNLGYEPQWVVAKAVAGGTGSWVMQDNMRGFTASPTVYTDNPLLFANSADSEATFGASTLQANATGFTTASATYDPSVTYIYIAIRRGPMKVPTDATTVFKPLTRNGTGAAASVTTVGFPPDIAMINIRDSGGRGFVDKLRGPKQSLTPSNTGSELTSPSTKDVGSFNQNGISFAGGTDQFSSNSSGLQYVNWYIKRSPSVFDIVCYTGTGSATTQTHNLGAVPELVIWKRRSSTSDWRVWQSSFSVNDGVYLNLNFAKDTDSTVQTAIPTATVLNLSTGAYTNASGSTYVAYLFATCAGVSKVGSYTGNGSSQTINCGFTSGARFVLIKRTDSTSDWYAYDTARGMTVLTDPYIPLNLDSANAEVATLGSVTTVSTGFALDSSILAAINVNTGTYIFLAFA